MEFNGHWLITINTLDGPWHVSSGVHIGHHKERLDANGKPIINGWHIVNILTGRTKWIGPVRMKVTNYFDRATAMAKERNVAFLKDIDKLPMYMGRHPEFDKTIARVLKQ